MKYTQNVLKILALKTFKGVGNAWIVKNFRPEYSDEELVELINTTKPQNEVITLNSFESIKQNIASKLDTTENDNAIAFGDRYFPTCRGKVPDSQQPVVLFYKGDIKLLSKTNRNLAVIGLLEPTTNIEKVERYVVKELVKKGITIVSGLALGCDTIAHDETLKNSGATVAILPSTLQKIAPSSNAELADEIVVNGGLLITEYFEEAKSKYEFINRYIQRDRLQALFSDGVVLSASYAPNNKGLDSGSRHAMEAAKSYGLKRAVIYNEKLHSNDVMYELNKQIAQHEGTIVINKDTFQKSIEKLIMQQVDLL